MQSAAAAATAIFPTKSLPKSITPTGSGNYYVPDPNNGIWNVQPGGSTTLTANMVGSNYEALDGVMLPNGYTDAGSYFVVGRSLNPTYGAVGWADLLPRNSLTMVYTDNSADQFSSVAITPAGFGAIEGQVVISDIFAGVDVLSESGGQYAVGAFHNLSGFYYPIPYDSAGDALPGFFGFGLAFAPGSFGSMGGDLLVSSDNTGQILAVDPIGNASLFADIQLLPGQNRITGQYGLRQMAFAPQGFSANGLDLGGNLIVSVLGGRGGGGTFGAIDAVNAVGQVVATLDQGAIGSPFDLRGLYFPDSQHLWFSDADPALYSVTAADFKTVPKPGMLPIIGIGFAVLGLLRRRLDLPTKSRHISENEIRHRFHLKRLH